MTDDEFYVASMFGYHQKRPLVSVKLRDVAVQVTPMKAREMAFMLLEAAESAEGDGFVLSFLSESADLNERDRADVLQLFRQYRLGQMARDELNEQGQE